MKKYVLLIFNLLILFSIVILWGGQTHIRTTYSYNNVTIERVDECGKTFFFYNKIDKNTSIIIAKYSGIDSNFRGYLKFEENGKVLFFPGGGWGLFEKANVDTTQFEYKNETLWDDNIKENVYFVQLSIKAEIQGDENKITKVKAVYHKLNFFEWIFYALKFRIACYYDKVEKYPCI